MLPSMSRRETRRRAEQLRRTQTDHFRALRNQTLRDLAENERKKESVHGAIHYELMVMQWSMIDDAQDYLTAELNKLSRDYRARSVLSAIVAVLGFAVAGPWLWGWLSG